MSRLQIREPRERMLVTLADGLLGAAAGIVSPFRHAVRPVSPRRILLLRLERIGDLLMALPAIVDVRAHVPNAQIDLVVGQWNASLAGAIRDVDRVETVDAQWLARDDSGKTATQLLRNARGWRSRHYDLAINFEPDVRSNLLLAVSGAAWTAGYRSGGGGGLLDQVLDYDPASHTTDNARRLVASVLGGSQADSIVEQARASALNLPAAAHAEAARLVRPGAGPLIALHVCAGRTVKQWPEARFREVAAHLISERGACVVLTGASDDRAQVDAVRAGLPSDRIQDVSGHADLLTLAAIFQRVALLVTGDTGPMHLAHAVGTPIVAIFGPSDPVRYAPRGALDRLVRIDLPCAPCNRIRRPPARCTGHTPDCLAGIGVSGVLEAIDEVLAARAPQPATGSCG
jgi:ADP-heptose:LPS heptosyltransferase